MALVTILGFSDPFRPTFKKTLRLTSPNGPVIISATLILALISYHNYSNSHLTSLPFSSPAFFLPFIHSFIHSFVHSRIHPLNKYN